MASVTNPSEAKVSEPTPGVWGAERPEHRCPQFVGACSGIPLYPTGFLSVGPDFGRLVEHWNFCEARKNGGVSSEW